MIQLEDAVVAAQAGDRDAIAEVEATGDWHLIRRTGIGGSDVAAVLGLDRWKRPIDVWLAKTGRTEHSDADQSEAARWGHLLEPLVADDYARVHVTEGLLEGPLRFRRRQVDTFHCGNIDRAVWSDIGWERVVEIKTRGWHRIGEYGDTGTDEVPLGEQCQVRWYMPLIGVQRGDVAVLFNTHQRRDYTIHRDARLERDLLDRVGSWWQRHVIGGVAPDADGSRSYARYLTQVYDSGRDSVEYVVPDPDDLRELDHLRTLSAMYRHVRDAYELARQRVGQRLGAAPGYDLAPLGGDGRLHYKTERGRVSLSGVVQELAELLGIDHATLAAIQERHRGAGSRVMRTPRSWSRDVVDSSVLAALSSTEEGVDE